MSHLPEEPPLDQTLREVFSEFDLPPAHHVWRGIEGQIGHLPGAARTWPRRLVVPAVALLGVGVGWLLPHPAPPPRKVPPRKEWSLSRLPEVPVHVVADTFVASAAEPGPPAVARGPVFRAKPLAVRRPRPASAAVVRPLPAASATAAPPSQPLADTARPAAVLPLSVGDTARAVAAGSLPAELALPASFPSDTAAENAPVSSAPQTATPKTDSPQELHTEYRVPTHRLAERGRGARRHLTHAIGWVRHVVSPRRSRTTAQPDF